MNLITGLMFAGVIAAMLAADKAGESEGDSTDPSATDPPDGDGETTTDPPDTGGGGDGKKFDQADVDKIVQDRLDRERKKEPVTPPAVQAELEELRAAEAAREEENRTELESAQAATLKAEEAAEASKAEAVEATRKRIIAEGIAEGGGDLPAAYRATVTGATEDEVKTSVQQAQAAYVEDTAAAGESAVRFVFSASPEELVERFGEEFGAEIARRVNGEPVNVGSETNPGGDPAPVSTEPSRFAAVADAPKGQKAKAWVAALGTKPDAQPTN